MNDLENYYKPGISGDNLIHLIGEFDFPINKAAKAVVNSLKNRAEYIGGLVSDYPNKNYFEVSREGYKWRCHYGPKDDYKRDRVLKIDTINAYTEETIDSTTVENLIANHEFAQELLKHVDFKIKEVE